MKQIHTKARKANTRYDKRGGNSMYCLSVAARRSMGILAHDSAEYDEKHGAVLQGARKRTKRLFGFLRRPQAKTA